MQYKQDLFGHNVYFPQSHRDFQLLNLRKWKQFCHNVGGGGGDDV